MVASIRVFGLDSSVEIRFPDAASETLLEAATHAWSRCLVERTVSREAEPLDAQPPADATDTGRAAALQMLTQDVTQRLIASQVGNLLMLHAGAVSHPETGESLVFVAPGGTGKTTLARVLGRHYGYLTDETVGIDVASGRIHPYPKPLSLRLPGRGPKEEASPDELGLVRAHPEPTIGRMIVLRRYDAHDGPPGVTPLATLDALEATIPETSSLWRLPQPLSTLAHVAGSNGPALLCAYAEAGDLLPVAADLIGDAL